MFIPEARTASKKATVKGTAMMIVMSLLLVLFVLGLTIWNSTGDTDIFTKTYDAIQNVKIGEFAIFSSILGNFEVFGAWSYTSLLPTIALAIIVLSIATHLSFKEMIEESYNGAKKVMKSAILVASSVL